MSILDHPDRSFFARQTEMLAADGFFNGMAPNLCPRCGAYWDCGCPLEAVVIEEAVEVTPEMYDLIGRRLAGRSAFPSDRQAENMRLVDDWAGRLADAGVAEQLVAEERASLHGFLDDVAHADAMRQADAFDDLLAGLNDAH